MKCLPLRPIATQFENLFHMVIRQLKEDALERQIENESYDQFCARVKETIQSYSVEYSDISIKSTGEVTAKHSSTTGIGEFYMTGKINKRSTHIT